MRGLTNLIHRNPLAPGVPCPPIVVHSRRLRDLERILRKRRIPEQSRSSLARQRCRKIHTPRGKRTPFLESSEKGSYSSSNSSRPTTDSTHRSRDIRSTLISSSEFPYSVYEIVWTNRPDGSLARTLQREKQEPSEFSAAPSPSGCCPLGPLFDCTQAFLQSRY
jgi:hypothetical protein